MPQHRQNIVLAYGQLLDELGALMDFAERQLPPDRYRVLESTGKKLILTLEGHMRQSGYLLDQFERLSESRLGGSSPSSDGPKHILVPFRRR